MAIRGGSRQRVGAACASGVLILAAAVVACSTGQRGTTTSGAPRSAVENACSAFASRLCRRLEACAGPTMAIVFGPLPECEAGIRLDCIDEATAPGSGWSVETSGQCAQSLETRPCEDLMAGNLSPSCTPPGRLAPGAICSSSTQCTSTQCAHAPGSQCGSCAPRPVLGSPCSESCGHDGLVCANATHTCVHPGVVGASCDPAAAPCGIGLVCRGMGATRTCQQAATTLGAACTASPTDAIHACDLTHGVLCDGRVGRCAAFRSAHAGEPCGRVGDAVVACDAHLACAGMAPERPSGTCTPTDRSVCHVGDPTGCPALMRCVAAPGASRGTCMRADSTVCREGYVPAPIAPANLLAIPGSVEGELTADDTALSDGSVADDYSVRLEAGQTVTIDVIGGDATSTPGTRLDMYALLMADGHEIAHDDDGAGDLNSRIVFTARDGAVFTLRVTTYGAGLKTGHYTVRTTVGALPLVVRDAGVVDAAVPASSGGP